MNKDLFVNPTTGEEVVASTDLTWLWFLLFGQLHTIFNGQCRSNRLLHMLVVFFTLGLAQLYFLFMCRTVARNYYWERGYVLKHIYDEKQKKEEST